MQKKIEEAGKLEKKESMIFDEAAEVFDEAAEELINVIEQNMKKKREKRKAAAEERKKLNINYNQYLKMKYLVAGKCKDCGKPREEKNIFLCYSCRDKHNAYQREYIKRRIAKGICYDCRKKHSRIGKKLCYACQKKKNELNKKRNDERIAKGLCISCQKPSQKGFRLCKDCRDRHNQQTKVWRKNWASKNPNKVKEIKTLMKKFIRSKASKYKNK